MVEVRFHGRGGQGAVTSVEICAISAIEDGKFAQGFPSFGPERRGAPVQAFLRISDKPIKLRSKIYKPDVIVVLDPSLVEAENPSLGLKEKGTIIINSGKSAQEIKKIFPEFRVAVIDAYSIAREEIGTPIANTTMIGALVKATGVISLKAMEESINNRFGRLAQKNINACRRAYEETVIL
jgi:pyruvate ferredoxin oxidoreductase gamma subunit